MTSPRHVNWTTWVITYNVTFASRLLTFQLYFYSRNFHKCRHINLIEDIERLRLAWLSCPNGINLFTLYSGCPQRGCKKKYAWRHIWLTLLHNGYKYKVRTFLSLELGSSNYGKSCVLWSFWGQIKSKNNNQLITLTLIN